MSEFVYGQVVREKSTGKVYRVVYQRICGLVLCSYKVVGCILIKNIKKDNLEVVNAQKSS